jgi:Polyketide cyclase / dehydrase and lipid transport
MPSFRLTVVSPLSPDEAFDRMAAFERVTEWDPNTSSARRLDAAIGFGARFAIETAFGGRTLSAEYRIAAYEPPRRLVLESVLKNVRLRDEITVVPDPEGCRMTYDARVTPTGAWKLAGPVLQVIFTRACRRTIGPLGEYLDGRTVSHS